VWPPKPFDLPVSGLSWLYPNPALRGANGVGPDVAAILLTAAGDNPERLKSEAAFAAMCGVSPVEASSGKTIRHRLNRSGNRQANHALWRIVMVRIATGDPATKTYVERRTAEGKSQHEIVRCLKRFVAREVYRHLVDPQPVPVGADLRAARTDARISLQLVADELGSWPSRISEIERGLKYDTALARRYAQWLVDHKQEAGSERQRDLSQRVAPALFDADHRAQGRASPSGWRLGRTGGWDQHGHTPGLPGHGPASA